MIKKLSKGFTLIELLVVIAIISIIAGFLVPTLLKGRGEAYKVQCANNQKQVFGYAQPYNDKSGSNAFPSGQGSEPAAHESLTRLVEYSMLRVANWREPLVSLTSPTSLILEV